MGRIRVIIRRCVRRGALCLTLGSGAILATCAVYGRDFVLLEAGSCWGMLALLLYGTHMQRTGRYPQILACSTVVAVWGLIVAGLAALLAGCTLLAPRAVGWAGPQPTHAGIAAFALGTGAALVMGSVLVCARLVVAVWRLAPGGACV